MMLESFSPSHCRQENILSPKERRYRRAEAPLASRLSGGAIISRAIGRSLLILRHYDWHIQCQALIACYRLRPSPPKASVTAR